jgi:hypothetical protein
LDRSLIPDFPVAEGHLLSSSKEIKMSLAAHLCSCQACFRGTHVVHRYSFSKDVEELQAPPDRLYRHLPVPVPAPVPVQAVAAAGSAQ